MDKVIIDGVDVSECEYYRAELETKMPYGEYVTEKDKCHYSGVEIIQNCKGNKGCTYKQLQRARAEIYELKESLKVFQRPDIVKVLIDYKIGELDRIEQKNGQLIEDNFKIAQKYTKLEQENEKQLKCLKEIKEILWQQINERGCAEIREDKILDKISECIGVE